MTRKQKYSFPMRRNHANGPDRRYTAALMVTKQQQPDKRRKTQSILQRNERAITMNTASSATMATVSASVDSATEKT